MPLKQVRQQLALLFSTLLAFAAPVCAEDWHTLVQPLGTVLVVESPTVVNTRLGGNPPFELGTDVTTVKTNTPLYFVRFYNPGAPVNPSGAIGSWVMRSAEVRGLTAAQIRDKFALPAMPSMMTMVQAPTGSTLYTGIAGPIAGWGSGGGQQSKLLGPPWVPAENYMNQQAMGDCVLCYRVLAPKGNQNQVAAYLDKRIPEAYSDLENVYTQLDLLYYGPTIPQFRQALEQISPLRYDNMVSDGLQANLLFNDSTDQRLNSLRQEQAHKHAWIQVAGAVQRAGDLGFNAHSRGIFAGADAPITENTRLGIAAAYIRSDLEWNAGQGRVDTDYAKLGLYTAWLSGQWVMQGGLNAGVSHGDVKRRLVFSGLSRTAQASPSAREGNAHVQIGYRFPVAGMEVMPVARLDYFYQSRAAFSETGADSLNLKVQPLKARTLRSHLGVNLSWEQALQNGQKFSPRLQIGWAHERPLDDRAITAALTGEPDSFTVLGDTRSQDALTLDTGIKLTTGETFYLFANYKLEYRRNMSDQSITAGMNYRF
jgi:outer membrane autotransporter protein